MNIKRCSEPRCHAHEGEGCHLGNRRHLCPAWSDAEPPDAAASPTDEGSRVLWSGAVLGMHDIGLLTVRGRSIILGVVGAHDAGKTTLLTGTYLMAQRGERIADTDFAGSRSLEAWESLATSMRFDDAARPPSFPPHTPRGLGRAPGLLHMALRGANDELRDVLLTDAPGELFTRWAMQQDSPECEGARWIAANADGFLVVADCVRLSGERRGAARDEIRAIIERLGDLAAQRPVILVWAKAEQAPPVGIRHAIDTALRDRIPQARQVESCIAKPETLSAAVGLLISTCWWPARRAASRVPVLSHTPFEGFRGHRDEA